MKKNIALMMTVLFPVVLVLGFSPSLSAKETSYTKSTATYKRIRAAIEKIGIVDSHEHLPSESALLKRGAPDFFDLAARSYVGCDISIIGNTFPHDKKYLDKSLSTEKRWKSFLPIYKRLKNTGYMRCVREGFKKVYNIEITDVFSVKDINENLKKMYNPGLYKKILYDLGNIDCVLNNIELLPKYRKEDYPDFFHGVANTQDIMLFTRPSDIYFLENQFKVPIHSLDDIETAYRKFLDKSIRSGIVGIKSTLAYYRTLDFYPYSREKAEALLKKLLGSTKRPGLKGDELTIEEGKELTNYCMHLMLRLLEEKGMPIAFHTGILTLGKNDIWETRPHHLISLFREYKNLNFDLYHGGFPFVTEFIELGKSWPNVFLNQCWSHIISPPGAQAQLSELLECVPLNKIFVFGGDYRSPELVIGHLEIAKENASIVLTEKVLNGYFSEAEAIEYAERIFRTNLIEFYNLKIPKRV